MEKLTRSFEYGGTGTKPRRRVYSFSPSVAVSNAALLAVSVLLSAYAPFEGISPFGTACIMAAWFAGANPYIACMGAIAGYVLSGSYPFAAASAAMGAGIFFISSLGNAARVYRLLFGFLIEAMTLGLACLVTKQGAVLKLGSACVSVFAAVVIGGALRAFRFIKGAKALSDTELITLSALAGLITLSMQGMSILGQSIATVFAGACALFAAYRFGIGAVAFAVTVGAGRSLAAGGDMRFIAVIAACALVAASLRALGKWAAMIGFAGCSALIAACVGGTSIFGYIETALICAVFAAVPQKLYMPDTLKDELIDPLLPGRKYNRLQYRLASLSEVLNELSRVYGNDEARLLKSISCTLKRFLNAGSERVNYRAEYSEAVSVKPGSIESGDSCVMREIEGKLLLALSDGMGSGGRAMNESRAALALLKDLLHVGFEISDAAECVNSLLSSRGEGDMYATLDVTLIDLKDATATFSKHGAPSSFILRNGRLHTLYSEALPIGIIDGAQGASRSVRLRDGDTVIMMTDGVSDALGTALCEAAAESVLGTEDMEKAARALLEAAEANGRCDDMSVIMARITKAA